MVGREDMACCFSFLHHDSAAAVLGGLGTGLPVPNRSEAGCHGQKRHSFPIETGLPQPTLRD